MTIQQAKEKRLRDLGRIEELKVDKISELDILARALVKKLSPHTLLPSFGKVGIELSATGQVFIIFAHGPQKLWDYNPDTKSLSPNLNAFATFEQRVPDFIHSWANRFEGEINDLKRDLRLINELMDKVYEEEESYD